MTAISFEGDGRDSGDQELERSGGSLIPYSPCCSIYHAMSYVVIAYYLKTAKSLGLAVYADSSSDAILQWILKLESVILNPYYLVKI